MGGRKGICGRPFPPPASARSSVFVPSGLGGCGRQVRVRSAPDPNFTSSSASRFTMEPAMHILAVEDEPRMAELLRSALSEEGHFVTVAFDGENALQLGCTGQFDVIVLDVMLPRLDGFSVARRLREQHIQTPLLMLTARDTPADIVKALDQGADDYLTKPFSLEVLL